MRIPKKRMLLTFCMLMFFIFLCAAFGQNPKPQLKTSFISPAGGEKWLPGATVTIKWIPGPSTDTTWNLILFKANPTQRIGIIRSGIPASVTSHQWKAGETEGGAISTGPDFFIRLQFTRDGKNPFIDSKIFSIKHMQYNKPRIVVTFPNKETEWWNGRYVAIKWTTKFLDIKTKMHISLWDEKGKNVIRGIGMGSNGSCNWQVPSDLIPEEVEYRRYKVMVKKYELISKGGGTAQKEPIFGMSETFQIRYEQRAR